MILEELSFIGKVSKVTFGSVNNTLSLGDQTTLPILDSNHKPKLALHISDSGLVFPKGVFDPYEEYYDELIEWARFCKQKYEVDALHVKFTNDFNVSNYLPELLRDVSLPLVISGPGEMEKDQQIINLCGELGEGYNLLLCSAELENYKSITATAMAYNHCIVALSPIDVNIAKQLNILLTDFGLSIDRIVLDPMVASVGYGLEYTFSVMERIRALALSGDQMLSSPMVCFVHEAWRAREASVEHPTWGSLALRGFLWEAMTATSLYAAGADLLVFRHPESLQLFRKTIGV